MVATMMEGNTRTALPLAGAIARNLGIQILSGHYKPGDAITGDIDASKQLRVSRATYREAMHILAAKGLVERRQRAGTHVAPVERWNWLDLDVIMWRCECGNIEQSLADFFELRQAIEPEVAALAATRNAEEELALMRHAVELMNSGVRLMKHSKMPLRQFRKGLFQASGNLYFIEVGRVIERIFSLFTAMSAGSGITAIHASRRYLELLDAILAQDPQRARRVACELVADDWRAVSARHSGNVMLYSHLRTLKSRSDRPSEEAHGPQQPVGPATP
jgi:DNA-binding FadR family transcriptional regulator